MIYLVSLPAVLIVAAMVSSVWQAIFQDFIDLAEVARVVMLTLVAWSLGGWWMEAQAGARMAQLYEECEARVEARLDKLYEEVFDSLLGEV